MNVNPWNQKESKTDVINDFDFIRKIEGSIIYEQVGIFNPMNQCTYVWWWTLEYERDGLIEFVISDFSDIYHPNFSAVKQTKKL